METFNEVEQEAIILKNMLDMINDMVNYEIFMDIKNEEDAVLVFPTSLHMRLFNVLLADFLQLSQSRRKEQSPFDLPDPPSGVRDSDLTQLFHLRRVCSSPKLGPNAAALSKTLEDFASWLEQDATVERVWFPSIQIETTIRISRILFLRTCGNIAKHNVFRLSDNVKRVRDIFKANGHSIDEGQAYLALPEFYEWFHTDIFAYHSSTIAEYLNNLRWEIYSYLRPEFRRAYYKVGSEGMYRFHVPVEIQQPVAHAMYWDLMNMVRDKPYMPRFKVSRYVKLRY